MYKINKWSKLFTELVMYGCDKSTIIDQSSVAIILIRQYVPRASIWHTLWVMHALHKKMWDEVGYNTDLDRVYAYNDNQRIKIRHMMTRI